MSTNRHAVDKQRWCGSRRCTWRATIDSDSLVLVHAATFELLAARVATGSSAVIVLVVYRPGSQTITVQFFAELADVLDRVVAFTDPVIVTGDFNVRLDRADDPAAQQMTDLLATYGFVCRVSELTHGRGGLLDVVATRSYQPAPSVEVSRVMAVIDFFWLVQYVV